MRIDLRDSMTPLNIHGIGVPEGEEWSRRFI